MEELRQVLEQYLNDQLQHIIISNPKNKGGVMKIHIRPVLLQDKLMFQVAQYTQKQVFHENLTSQECVEKILSLMEDYKQLELSHNVIKVTTLVSKKGKVTIKKKRQENACQESQALSHNRENNIC